MRKEKDTATKKKTQDNTITNVEAKEQKGNVRRRQSGHMAVATCNFGHWELRRHTQPHLEVAIAMAAQQHTDDNNWVSLMIDRGAAFHFFRHGLQRNCHDNNLSMEQGHN